jgi:hypothetical protein
VVFRLNHTHPETLLAFFYAFTKDHYSPETKWQYGAQRANSSHVSLENRLRVKETHGSMPRNRQNSSNFLKEGSPSLPRILDHA